MNNDMDFASIDQSIPRTLPLLDKWLGKHLHGEPFKNVTVLLIQHQLGSQFPQAKALLNLGLAPSQLIWIDVPYTSSPIVRQTMVNELNIPPTCFHVHDFCVLDRYPSYQIRRIQKVFAELLKNPPEKLIVLDDGAYFAEAVSCFAEQLPAVAIVEQTSRGLIKMEKNAALHLYASQYPVVNVARSGPKLTLEPPFIGRAVCDSLFRHVIPLLDASKPLRCLVLGFGAIGRQVAEFIPSKMDFDRSNVHVYDPDDHRQRIALEAGYSPWNRSDYKCRFHIVIGCSGRKSFTLGDRVYLEDGAVLASASSGTVELSRQKFIELAGISEVHDIKIIRDGLDPNNIHSDLQIKLVDRIVKFVNGGFPVNFDGRVNCIPGRYIQPTSAMMVAGAVQGTALLDNGRKGLVELDPEFCTWVDRAFKEELTDEERKLIEPRE